MIGLAVYNGARKCDILFSHPPAASGFHVRVNIQAVMCTRKPSGFVVLAPGCKGIFGTDVVRPSVVFVSGLLL